MGLIPGQVFPTIQKAAIDAVEYSMEKPDATEREYGGWIKQVDGGYTYDEPAAGPVRERSFSNFPKKSCGDAPAWYHTHYSRLFGIDEIFSGTIRNIRGEFRGSDDKGYALATGSIGYLGTPSGLIKVYLPFVGDKTVGRWK